MMSSSMTRRSVTSILLLAVAVAVGCTDRPPTETETEKKTGPEGATAPVDPAPGENVLDFHMKKGAVAEAQSPEQKARMERRLSRLGPIDLTLHDGPATADPVEPGRYLLSINMWLSNNNPMGQQNPCRVEVEGPNVKILLENSGADPIIGTLEDGEFFSEPREGPGTYGLEGQVVGPGKLRGMIVPGPEPHPSVDIIEGRWGLDALPLADATVK